MPWSVAAISANLRAVANLPTNKALPTRRSTSFDPDVALAFGEVFQSMRVERGHAQDAFALVAGVDRSYYGKLERGERQPSVGLLLRISKAFGVSGAEVMAAAEQLMAKRARQKVRRR
ncbi:helix-turn-helix domain-containing protein [Roseateles sp. PN1]|uniref:helix-turn-helix domain-containing protein n=1 Tax=Roseateles sp. PN1 TaxID=3137372 RepID=UPI004053B838